MADDEQHPPAARKRIPQWPVLLWLAFATVLFWGDLSIGNIVAGLVIAILVTLVFPLPPIRFSGRVRIVALTRLVARFFFDLVLASAHVAAQVVDFRRQPPTSIVAIRLCSRSDLYLTLTAEMLSLIPGSLVVEADRSTWTLYLHVLGAESEEDISRARELALKQEANIIRALGSDTEVEAFDDRRRRENQS